MADKAISELIAAEQVKATDLLVMEQDGSEFRWPVLTLLRLLPYLAIAKRRCSLVLETHMRWATPKWCLLCR